MLLRHIGLLCLVPLAVAGCSDDEDGTKAGRDAGQVAGSCDLIMVNGLCHDYAEADAFGQEANCATAGGLWTSAQCPLGDRKGVCEGNGEATRTIAYTAAAAASLMESCPEGGYREVKQDAGKPDVMPGLDASADDDGGAPAPGDDAGSDTDAG